MYIYDISRLRVNVGGFVGPMGVKITVIFFGTHYKSGQI